MTTQAVQVHRPKLPTGITQSLQVAMLDIPQILPPDIAFEQFRSALFLELSQQYGLKDCDPKSVVTCAIKAATYGMLPGRDCHFLPFSSKRKGGGKEATYVPNYFGVIRVLMRTGKVAKPFAHPVYTRDVFEVDYFADRPTHRPPRGGKRGELECFYGAIVMLDRARTCHFEVMSLEEIDAVKKRAPAHDSGPWTTDYLMMARKTCIKRVAKYVQLTPDVQRMLEEDEAREGGDFDPHRGERSAVELFPPRPGEQVDPKTGEVLDDVPDPETPEGLFDKTESAKMDQELAKGE